MQLLLNYIQGRWEKRELWVDLNSANICLYEGQEPSDWFMYLP